MKEEFKWRKHVCKRNVKGSPKMKHWSNDYPEFWPRREGWQSKQKQCDRKESVTVTQFALQSNGVGDGAIYSRLPNCCEGKWAADSAVTDHGDLTVKLTADTLRLQMNHVRTEKGILVQKKSSVIGGRRIFLMKMYYHRRQGYLPKLVTRICEMPTTFESSVVK